MKPPPSFDLIVHKYIPVRQSGRLFKFSLLSIVNDPRIAEYDVLDMSPIHNYTDEKQQHVYNTQQKKG